MISDIFGQADDRILSTLDTCPVFAEASLPGVLSTLGRAADGDDLSTLGVAAR